MRKPWLLMPPAVLLVGTALVLGIVKLHNEAVDRELNAEVAARRRTQQSAELARATDRDRSESKQRDREALKIITGIVDASEVRPLITALDVRGNQLVAQMTDGFRGMPKTARKQVAYRLLTLWKAADAVPRADARIRLVASGGETIGRSEFFGSGVKVDED